MTIQAQGDYAKATALAARLGVVRPPVQRALDKLTAVPVDIEPRFATADRLLNPTPARPATPPRPALRCRYVQCPDSAGP